MCCVSLPRFFLKLFLCSTKWSFVVSLRVRRRMRTTNSLHDADATHTRKPFLHLLGAIGFTASSLLRQPEWPKGPRQGPLPLPNHRLTYVLTHVLPPTMMTWHHHLPVEYGNRPKRGLQESVVSVWLCDTSIGYPTTTTMDALRHPLSSKVSHY